MCAPEQQDSSRRMGRNLERAIGALNGLVGDYLDRSGNGLATPMMLLADGARIDVGAPDRLLRFSKGQGAAPPPTRLVVLIHGLMSTEDVFLFAPPPAPPKTYGTLLAEDLGFAAFEARYNSGKRISENGAALSELLRSLVEEWPCAVQDIVLIGHSMGGLVARAATHAASEREDASWLPKVSHAIYLGSPHLGAPLERMGNVVTWALAKVGHPITELIAEIGNLRSAGVKDLRYGSLRREDWEGADPDALLMNRRHPVPLLPHIRHHLMVGTIERDVTSTMLFGDWLVPVRSASGDAAEPDRSPRFPQDRVRLFGGRHHLALAHDAEVYTHIRSICETPPGEHFGGKIP